MIYATAPEEGEFADAIVDRLTRAAEGRVVRSTMTVPAR